MDIGNFNYQEQLTQALNGLEIINTKTGRLQFEPNDFGLNSPFRFTQYARRDAKGVIASSEVKMYPTTSDLSELANLIDEDFARIAAELNISLIQVDSSKLIMLKSTVQIGPIVNHPYVVGKIACVNVLANFYALGVKRCEDISLFISLHQDMSQEEKDMVTQLTVHAFKVTAYEDGFNFSIHEINTGPLLYIKAIASVLVSPEACLIRNNAVAGDVLLLTKALGTQLILNLYQWLDQPEMWKKVKKVISKEEVIQIYQRTMYYMMRSNRVAGNLMEKYDIHCATVVAELGLVGSAQIMASRQIDVAFCIHNLPIIEKMPAVAKNSGQLFGLLRGESPEISGGLLICLPRTQAAAMVKDIRNIEGCRAWIIGTVSEGYSNAFLIDKPRIIEEPEKF